MTTKYTIFKGGKYFMTVEGTIEQARAFMCDTVEFTGSEDLQIRTADRSAVVEPLLDYEAEGLTIAGDAGDCWDEDETGDDMWYTDDTDASDYVDAETEADIIAERDADIEGDLEFIRNTYA